MNENELLEAVQRLARPHTTKVVQRPDDSEPFVTVVEHEPLLIQLRDAIVGGIGAHEGSAAGRERIPFNPVALQLFDDIALQINRWYIVLPGAREERHIHERLSDWYVDYENRRRAGKVGDSTEKATLTMLEGWVRSIESLFDPPTVFELTHIVGERNVPVPCPVCGNPRAFDPKTGDVMSALVIEYRNLGEQTLDKATGLCRACATVWRGRNGVRELRWMIDQAEGATA